MEVLEEVVSEKCEVLTNLLEEVINLSTKGKSKTGGCLLKCLKTLKERLQEAAPAGRQVAGFACRYDLGEQVRGNGYRSYTRVFTQGLNCSIQECKEIREKMYSWLFNSSHYAKIIESWSNVFAAFALIFRMLVNIHMSSEDGCLVPKESEQLLNNVDSTAKLDVSAFYGHVAGFQLLPSVRVFMAGWCTFLSMFSDMSSAGVVNNTYTPAIINGMKYMFDKEARAKRVVALSSKGPVKFFTKFLAITDSWFVVNFCSLAEPSVPVNIHVSVPPAILELQTQNGGIMKVTPPSSSLGLRPLDCRLICAQWRQGMIGNSSSQSQSGPAYGLVMYYHGGGFVATSSKNFEVYLKYWANKLDVPIFCVDYTLAPEARYPRQLEECFFAYCWALKNANLLGTTADKICFCGDSAGGTLAMGVVLKCIEHGVRLPSGIFLAYTPLILDMTMCPARLLSLIDPIIPFGFLIKCFEAYLGESAGKIPELISDFIHVDEKELEHMKTLCSRESAADVPNNVICKEGTTSSLRNAAYSILSNLTKYLPSLDSSGSHSSSSTLESGKMIETHTDEIEILSKSISKETRNDKFAKMTVTTSIADHTTVRNFHNCNISPDPYLSPYYAGPQLLCKLPKTVLMTTDLDPCLDDNVAFAKKLRGCGVDFSLDVLEGLPHGFLMFVLGSEDAKRGSKQAIAYIRSVLES